MKIKIKKNENGDGAFICCSDDGVSGFSFFVPSHEAKALGEDLVAAAQSLQVVSPLRSCEGS